MNTKQYLATYYSSPNQKIGVIVKPKYKEKGMKFMLVGIDEIREAATTLSPSALKLYLYFVENENGWEFALSPQDFLNTYKISESSYRNAKKELIEKGYIIEREKNHFEFTSSPLRETIDIETLGNEFIKLAQSIKIYDEQVAAELKKEVVALEEKQQQNKISDLDYKKQFSQIIVKMRRTLQELIKKECSF